jgi:hypothetical protein
MPITETQAPNFIKLKNQTIATYAIQYNINQCFHLQHVEQISSKHQFYFKGLLEKEQVYELMLVDTAFAEVVGKLAQEVLVEKVKTLREFLSIHNHATIINGYTDAFYYQFKFEHWLMQLFFPEENVHLNKESKTQLSANTRSVYVLKNDKGELAYFSIFERIIFFELLFDLMQLRIDLKKSTIENGLLTLTLLLEI